MLCAVTVVSAEDAAPATDTDAARAAEDAPATAEADPAPSRAIDHWDPHPRGFAYIGAFFVTNINTQLSVFSQNGPIGTRVDFATDLGVRNSLTVPRVHFNWRFGKRHILGFNWYELARDGTNTLQRDIRIFNSQIGPNIDVASFYETDIYKVGYTYFFHNDRKVSLGVGGGLFVAGLKAGIRADSTIVEVDEDGSFTAPLPVVGGRLVYRVNRRMNVLVSADWFFLKYDEYAGVLSDFQFYVTHRTWRHVGFAAGVNLQALNVEVDDTLQNSCCFALARA